MECKVVLEKALALIERGWCQGQMAKDIYGNNVGYIDPEATKFCALGAIFRAARDEGVDTSPCVSIMTDVIKETRRTFLGIPLWKYYGSITHFNDYSPKTRVVTAFKRAIERAS